MVLKLQTLFRQMRFLPISKLLSPPMSIHHYLDKINQHYTLGNATEHTFRGDLQQLIESIVLGIAATNETKRQACDAPDYILT